MGGEHQARRTDLATGHRAANTKFRFKFKNSNKRWKLKTQRYEGPGAKKIHFFGGPSHKGRHPLDNETVLPRAWLLYRIVVQMNRILKLYGARFSVARAIAR